MSYKPIAITETDDDLELPENREARNGNSRMEPMEVASSEDGLSDEIVSEVDVLFSWENPWLPSIAICYLLAVPILIGNIITFHSLTGRLWLTTPFVFHLLLCVLAARRHIVQERKSIDSSELGQKFLALSSFADIFLFGCVYPIVWKKMTVMFFTEPDQTDVIEWVHLKSAFRIYLCTSLATAVLRVVLGAVTIISRRSCLESYRISTGGSSSLASPFLVLCSSPSGWMLRSPHLIPGIHYSLVIFANVSVGIAAVLLVWCLHSCAVHLIPAWPTRYTYQNCDPLDDTECALPFPSFHHMVRDPSTPTGWKVNLRERTLFPLRGHFAAVPEFVQQLDGFSTMAPMLFYLPGLKEAHEAGIHQLQGHRDIANSVTAKSATLLLDVTTQILVAHSAEIDYLDPTRPLVMLFPAQPLKHNTHYAVAVINAKGVDGARLPPTPGMLNLLSDLSSERLTRYLAKVIPALENAAPWFSFMTDPQSLQLLFDFHTISKDSQLGPVRAVRDATISTVTSERWNWNRHVRTNRVIDHDCENESIARTVYAEIDSPWFLAVAGPGSRYASMDQDAVRSGRPKHHGIAKFVVRIPCSVKAAALGLQEGKPVRAVLDFGHGLFASKEESAEDFLADMANRNGYVLIAMDWRGMSVYDLLVVAKVLLSSPSLFSSLRDNLIQGFANKYALQDFARKKMLSMYWFRFTSLNPSVPSFQDNIVPTYENKQPSFVFYGISQGGILGAGYVALSGVTKLIDRAVLGSAGTPFALILTRSLDFTRYDQIMLLNFQNNRHVRIFLAIGQMAWDSVEASGVLATPVEEPYPRILIQAGLGDAVVPVIASEALARGFNASIVSETPRQIFGIPRGAAGTAASPGPYVTLSELIYDKEYLQLPSDNVPPKKNFIHTCFRRDIAMIHQLEWFINTGVIDNPCKLNSCHRDTDSC